MVLFLGAAMILWTRGIWLDGRAGVFYMFAGGIGFMAFFYLSVKHLRKFKAFCAIANPSYEQVDVRHSQKVMLYSLLKYFAVICTLVTISYGIFIGPLILVYFIMIDCTLKYIKLWKHHGYSVPLLMIMTVAVTAASFAVAPFIRAGAWVVISNFLIMIR